MAKLMIRWKRIVASDEIRRSSQTIGVVGETLNIFGGELKPRKAVEGGVHTVDLKAGASIISNTSSSSSSPQPRVGAASTTLAGTVYIFSGRGGTAMTPLESEAGTLWAYTNHTWTLIEPSNPTLPTPPPRSYHTMTNDGRGALYLHAGCPASGRLNDLWVFQVSTRKWIQLASAPGPERGGSSIAFCDGQDVLYRMSGFDGKQEVGGVIDKYKPDADCWTSKTYDADGQQGPEARSVGCLLCVAVDGEEYLLTAFGERDPSTLGHAGAGKMLGDVWAWDLQQESWSKVEVESEEKPEPRGWFAAEKYGDGEIVIQGGLAEDNSRLGDVWVGTLSAAI